MTLIDDAAALLMRLELPIMVLNLISSSPAIGQAPVQASPIPFVAPQYALGTPSADVTVVEYFSDTCPHCAAFDRLVFPYVKARYIGSGRIRYIFREALTPPATISAAGFILARCAGEDKYLDVVEDIFKDQDAVVTLQTSREALLEIGHRAGLTDRRIQDCLSDDVAVKAFRARVDAAVAAGVEGTPTFVFNGRTLLPGERLARSSYQGGNLTKAQFDAAYLAAVKDLHRARR